MNSNKNRCATSTISINTLVSVPSKFLIYYFSLGILLNYYTNIFETEECMNDKKQRWVKRQELLLHCWVTVVSSCQAQATGTASKHHPGRTLSKHIHYVHSFWSTGPDKLRIGKKYFIVLLSTVKAKYSDFQQQEQLCAHYRNAQIFTKSSRHSSPFLKTA